MRAERKPFRLGGRTGWDLTTKKIRMKTMRDPFLCSGSDVSAASVVIADGPVIAFGGCYSNLEATEALLAATTRLGVPPARVVCTGDVVAYGADARATVARVRDSGIHVVMGNCEESLGWRRQDCGCGFAEGSACERAAVAWYRHADSQLDADARAWMRDLPRRIDIVIGGHRFAVVHGALDGINTFLFASAPDEEIRRQVALAGCDGVIAGHCGLPFTRVGDGWLWHNCGAIGMPANDGTPRTWFSLIEPCGRGVRVRHLPLESDVTAAAGKMRAAGLPEGYAVALETGLWPSCEVLPPAERARRGLPLAAGETLWPEPPADPLLFPIKEKPE